MGAKKCERGGIAKSRPWVDLLTEMEKDFRDELQDVGQLTNEKKRIGISEGNIRGKQDVDQSTFVH